MSTINPDLVTRSALESWLLGYHKTTASLDASATTQKYFTHDVEVKYGNNEEIKGRDAVKGFFEVAFSALDVLIHEIDYFDFVAPDRLYQAATIKYVVKGDDRETQLISIPGLLSGRLVEEDGSLKLKRAEIYLDASEIFKRMGEKGLLG